MYSAPLGKVIKDPNVKKKAYADDNYLYVAFSIQVIDDEISSTQLLERCFLDVKCWLKHNMLKLNDDKTKLIVFTPKKYIRSFIDLSLTFGTEIITSVPLVKILGVLFDSSLSMEKHINAKTNLSTS